MHNYFLELVTPNLLRFGMYNGSSWPMASATISATTNMWHHVVGTYSGGTITLYLDGNKFAENTGAGNPTPGGTCYFSIGANYSESTKYFNGSLDDIRLYNKALDPSEVQILYRQGL